MTKHRIYRIEDEVKDNSSLTLNRLPFSPGEEVKVVIYRKNQQYEPYVKGFLERHWPDHVSFNKTWGRVALFFAIVSLVLAVLAPLFQSNVQLGKFIIGVWVLFPPIFFWLDWVFYCPEDPEDQENLKHTHDLARNIWLAFV